ncbi:SAM-dependent methyltransferase [Actinoplanes sp. KI2]|uniref:SAM-dependent methyltransferase n=1 Tax=Actinoplanes sp. KI2 TaxID=2983315 RepID=UPI0021D5C389|nr:SAM-dependent methyltransferase [Actinoplanes sp. KI2]MCU7728433.1 SAM-dependent methyltransferase [Actinoplanes sp. KI2]
MTEFAARSTRKAATAARMYDYYLGGMHNFPADREAADAVIERFPFVPGAARANRAFVVNAVRRLSESGIRQFLDIGSGLPTVDNVHSVARRIHPDTRVAYVDLDPVAVAESLDILDGDGLAVAVLGDVQRPQSIVDHPEVRRLLDFDRPIGVILAAVLHFVPEHRVADEAVATLIASVVAGSYFVMSHTATESFELFTATEDVYQRRTSTPGTIRTHAEVERLFTGLEVLDPGVVWAQEWRSGAVGERVESPGAGGVWAGVGRKP